MGGMGDSVCVSVGVSARYRVQRRQAFTRPRIATRRAVSLGPLQRFPFLFARHLPHTMLANRRASMSYCRAQPEKSAQSCLKVICREVFWLLAAPILLVCP